MIEPLFGERFSEASVIGETMFNTLTDEQLSIQRNCAAIATVPSMRMRVIARAGTGKSTIGVLLPLLFIFNYGHFIFLQAKQQPWKLW